MKKSVLAIVLAVFTVFSTAVTLCVRALYTTEAVSAFDEEMRIVVDAGHGGIDGGVTGRITGVKESELNLAIAFKLTQELEEMGFEVTMTRKTSAGLYDTTAKGFKKRDMQRRKEISEQARPSLIRSVHQNFYPANTSRGGQVFYHEENKGGKLFAEGIQAALNTLYEGQGAKGRKVAKGDYFMLQCYACPSVIAECGFLSNAEDERLLRSGIFQSAVAKAIAVGVVNYLSGSVA